MLLTAPWPPPLSPVKIGPSAFIQRRELEIPEQEVGGQALVRLLCLGVCPRSTSSRMAAAVPCFLGLQRTSHIHLPRWAAQGHPAAAMAWSRSGTHKHRQPPPIQLWPKVEFSWKISKEQVKPMTIHTACFTVDSVVSQNINTDKSATLYLWKNSAAQNAVIVLKTQNDNTLKLWHKMEKYWENDVLSLENARSTVKAGQESHGRERLRLKRKCWQGGVWGKKL